MKEEVLDIAYIKNVVIEEAKKHSDIESVMLIGSYAKGKATSESDIDLIMEVDLDTCSTDTFFDFLDSLEERLDKKIDLLSKLGVEKSPLRESLLKGGKTLYVKS